MRRDKQKGSQLPFGGDKMVEVLKEMKVLIGGFKAKEGKELKTPIYMQA